MKQLKDYTLGEVQDICNGRNRVCKNGDDECLFCKYHKNRYCKVHSNGPSDWDLKERKNFSNDQLVVMKELYKSGIRYIVRDEKGSVYLHTNKPGRAENIWVEYDGKFFRIPTSMFPQIVWDDEEPVCIADYVNTDS